MHKSATLRLENNLEQVIGVILTITENYRPSIEVSGTLPPNPSLNNTISQWQSNYRSLGTTRIRPNEVIYDASIHQRRLTCQKLDEELRSHLNAWLSSPSFASIREKWLEELMKDEVRILVRASNSPLLTLPWQLWELVERNPRAEVALSLVDGEPVIAPATPTLRDKVKILAILGNSTGIDVQRDRLILNNFAHDAETTFLVEPRRQDINDRLWEQTWDILYFAGHSRTEGKRGRIYINETDSLTIDELRYALKKAVDKGLQIAIFNSCDGMGLAFELQQLNLPQAIVMREPVPDEIAQEFLKYFLPALASGKSLHLAEREARLRLHGRENEFPGASWLPVIFQSPATTPPTWTDLGRRVTDICPYRGLFAFGEEDVLFFYGREDFTQTLVNAIQRQNLVSIVGASGSGKSSVVFAGLVVALRQQGSWEIVALRPGQRPFQAIAHAWVTLRESDRPQADRLRSVLQLAQAWQADSSALSTALEEAVWSAPGTKLLIAVDQFEELYTQCRDAEERLAFIDRLLDASQLTNVAVVLTLRADFLGQALGHPPLADALQQGNRMLGAMNRAELEAAIAKPAELLGVDFEEGLIDRTIEAVRQSEGNLPLLEFALQQLWGKRQGTQLTHAAYDEIGGLEGAVARHAENAYNRLSDLDQERARRIFLQLVRPGEGTVDTRRIATRAEIGEDNWELVTRLASDRLVVTGQDAIAKTETAELIHEALIPEWSRLRAWIDEDRDFRLWQERLRAAMQQWEKSDRDEGALLRGKPLLDAEDCLRKRPNELTAEREFISSSLALRQREQENLERRRKRTIIGLTGGLIGALGLAAVAAVGWWFANNAATNNRIKALVSESRTLFTLSEEESKGSYSPYSKAQQEEKKRQNEILYQQASLKAIKAGKELKYAIAIDRETQFQVLEALQRVIGTRVKPKQFTLRECNPNMRGSLALAWTSDRKAIACVSYDGTVRLWDGETGKKSHVFRGDSEWVDDVQFSPDGKAIASGTVDGTVKLWKRSTGKEIRSFKGSLSQVASISLSRDRQTIAAANYDGTITIWEVATGKKLKILSGHPNLPYGRVPNVLFSPNGKFLASEADGDSLKIWEVSTAKELKTVRIKGAFYKIPFRFSSDSQTLIYSTGDYKSSNVSFWSISENRELKRISIPGVANFNSDGRIMAVVNNRYDNISAKPSGTKSSVSLWNTTTGKKIAQLQDSYTFYNRLAFSLDSETIAVSMSDTINSNSIPNYNSRITLWNRSGTELRTIKQLGSISDLSFSPDGRKIAIASGGMSQDKLGHVVLNLWDVSMGKQLKLLFDEIVGSEGLNAGFEVRFSPDGNAIAVTSSSKVARFFDTSTGAELNAPNVNFFRTLPPIISRDGKKSRTLSTDGSLRMRNLSTGKEHKYNRFDPVLTIGTYISDNDKTITTVNWYGKLLKRELATGRIIRSTDLPFTNAVSNLEFSSDGRQIATANSDNRITIWDATTGKEIITFQEYPSKTDSTWLKNRLYFSPDGKIVVALGREEFYRKGANLEMWDISTGKAILFPKQISNVKSISFRDKNKEVAILKADNTIELWNLSSRQLIKTIIPTMQNVSDIKFFPKDSDLIFIQGNAGALNSDGNLKIFNISTEREIVSFKIASGTPESVDFADDRKTLLLRSNNTFTLLNLDLNELLKFSCNVSRQFLDKDLSINDDDRHVCDSVS